MITAIKIILMIAIIALLSYPFITVKHKKLRRIFLASTLRYEAPHTRKNIFFVLLTLAEFGITALLFKLFDKAAAFIESIPFVGSLISNAVKSVNSHVDCVVLVIKMILINLVILYAFLILKAILKIFILNPLFHIGKREKFSFAKLFARWKERRANKLTKEEKKERKKKKKEEKETDSSDSAEEEKEKVRKRRRIPDFVHTIFEDDDTDMAKAEDGKDGEPKEKKQYGRIASFILSIFFEGDEFQYARVWVIRTRMILQTFVYFVETLYVVFLLTMLASIFFPMPQFMYNLLINVLHVGDWYLYPTISILFLQEICNMFNLPGLDEKFEEIEKKEEIKEDLHREARLRALLAELKKRFDTEHALRYYPEVAHKEVPKYECTNVTYASALEYISKQMERSSGRVVQSYMECLDAIYNDMNVYFPASFYSELGEYLIAYTYIRLLSGARMIFVVSDPEEKETLRTYIGDRLMKMTGSSSIASWRVYTANERLDQADVLIVTPDDFREDHLVEQYTAFFEEVCNAVFIDADKMIAMDSYLCPIIASRLKKATNGRIRFTFLSLDLLKGFAAKNLPKFFCIDKVLSFSSAEENEAVSYVLWNKESKNRRIYNKSGQKLTCLEIIIAEQAFQYGMDGVRVITEAPLEHAEKQALALHDVEINNLYKSIVDVNYMIYSDDRCNLSAALYACTRFRGRKKSVVHIISKPYLLREYFVSKANTEDYINRSSFIQPRVTEHAENHKLSLLRVFCDVTAEDGLPVDEFARKMRSVIMTQKEKNEKISSVFCRELLREKSVEALKISELAAYLVAGLCDNDPFEVPSEDKNAYLINSIGNRAKDFYLIIDPACQNCYALTREKKIVFNRTKEVFSYVFACNKRVELRLNDEVLGILDTFPGRVHLEYVVGQSIIYKNAEYEIEHIAEDGSAIYLRHENVGIRNCLDTFLLRYYNVNALTETGKNGNWNHSTAKLAEIRVSQCKANFSGSTYGFYSLTTDKQTIDFYHGVEGNSHIDNPYVRTLTGGDVLRVTLTARMECTDGMRRLLAAVCNEFIRTIFPKAYHCVAICPILAEPTPDHETMEDTPENRIRTLYPYLKNPSEEFVETDSHRMQFLFINDCAEDVGVLDWFFDPAGRYMQEFLANVYSYLHWLQLRPEKAHYIYFGGTALPESYDLNGCCELLEGFNLVFSDDGKKDFETAGDDVSTEMLECCSFCHKPMESGRFSFFDKHRFICADCFETVDEQSQLEEAYISMREYVTKQYPEITFDSARVKFDSVYALEPGQTLSEYYYRMDFAARTIFVEVDNPIQNVRVSVLRGILALWQSDNKMMNHYAAAQLYYEEICYLRSIGNDTSADWTYHALSESLRSCVDEISDYINFKDMVTDETSETPVDETARERRTSFSFMVLKAAEMKYDDDDDDDSRFFDDDDESSDSLFDPNSVPRFWKRYLRGEKLDDGTEEDLSDADDEESEDDDSNGKGEEVPVNSARFDYVLPNCPPTDVEEETVEEQTEENKDDSFAKDEKKRKKEEKKRLREEKRRQKQLEWEKSLDALEEEEKAKKGDTSSTDDKDEPTKKKRGFFGLKKKNGAEEDTTEADDESKDESKDDSKDKKDGGDKDLSEDDTDTISEDDTEQGEDDSSEGDKDGTDDTDNEPKKKKGDKDEKKAKRKGFFKKKNREQPHDDDEEQNPRIRLYNAIVKAAYAYSEAPFSRVGVSDSDVHKIVLYVLHDYPELFWVDWYGYASATEMYLKFRCETGGKLDIKQVNRKRAELKKAAKYFTKGITKKTDPYEAVLKIYRRLVLTLDYDHARLNSHTSEDKSRDDVVRSLHAALVEHKVVCAGYAVAMQYLLQSIGIVCGYVVSELNATGTTCHAFNILKIGKYCYYLDATWGDSSSTLSDKNKDCVEYDYFCTPYREFVCASPDSVPMHIPRKEYYPTLEKFNYTKHEYFRYHKAYLQSYDENELIRIFAEAALRYDPDEMGKFHVGFRCTDGHLAKHICQTLSNKGKIFEIIRKAQAMVAKKNKKAAKLLECGSVYHSCHENTGTVYYTFENDSSNQKKN